MTPEPKRQESSFRWAPVGPRLATETGVSFYSAQQRSAAGEVSIDLRPEVEPKVAFIYEARPPSSYRQIEDGRTRPPRTTLVRDMGHATVLPAGRRN